MCYFCNNLDHPIMTCWNGIEFKLNFCPKCGRAIGKNLIEDKAYSDEFILDWVRAKGGLDYLKIRNQLLDSILCILLGSSEGKISYEEALAKAKQLKRMEDSNGNDSVSM